MGSSARVKLAELLHDTVELGEVTSGSQAEYQIKTRGAIIFKGEPGVLYNAEIERSHNESTEKGKRPRA